ncbi:MAG TPA: hypothetical protein VFE15_13485 [Marmoricola sp.]|jgi:hypothetical protein|nr:hypothetical protein [Marmoricola sp.]
MAFDTVRSTRPDEVGPFSPGLGGLLLSLAVTSVTSLVRIWSPDARPSSVSRSPEHA